MYTLDNRGAGQSDKPVSYSYTIEEMARDTIGFMDAVGIESAHFNGISMGGAITQYLAVHYPERVRSIILTNTFPSCCVSHRNSARGLRSAGWHHLWSSGTMDDLCAAIPGNGRDLYVGL